MAKRRKERPAETTRFYQLAFRWMSFGAELCLVIGLFMLVGYFLDKKLKNPSPDLMILGFFIGLGTMVYIFVKRVQVTQHELDEMQNEQNKDDD